MRKAHMDPNSQPRPATGHGMFFAAVLLVLVFPAPESVRAQEIDFSKEVLPVLSPSPAKAALTRLHPYR